MDNIAIWIIATLVAFYIKGLCGFANTMVFTTILGFGVNNVNISPVELVLGYPTNVILTIDNRKKLNPKIFVPMIALIILGSIPGAFILKYVNANIIKIIFGVVVILVGIEMLLKELDRFHLKDSKTIYAIFGVMAGLMAGMFGVGVLMAACVSRMTKSNDEFKANLSIIFIVENTVRVITYALIGVITAESLKLSIYMVPIMLIGLFAGIKSAHVLDEKIVKRLVIILLIISGLALIVKSL